MEEKFNEFLKVIVYPVFAYLGIDLETTLLLIILMLVDSFLGAIKAYRLKYRKRTDAKLKNKTMRNETIQKFTNMVRWILSTDTLDTLHLHGRMARQYIGLRI
jgi:hypothetical protein